MRIPRTLKELLTHRDRWRVDQMLAEQPDLHERDADRDFDLWRHLFSPDDFIRVGNEVERAGEVHVAEYCWGNIWRDGEMVATAAVCISTPSLIRGATCSAEMNHAQACEAMLGRLRASGMTIVMVVDDGDDGLECWIDPVPGSYPASSRGRCPGGINSKTGRVHRVVWADLATRIDWDRDGATEEVA